VLKVDGKEVATLKIPHTIPFLMPADETFDVGMDMRTPINDKDYAVPFRFTGSISLFPLTFTARCGEVSTVETHGSHATWG
jgi:hypothetical protein